jgi:raffinose/stachyose/melibiose transport system permease protein
VNISLTSGGPSTMFLDKPIFGTELLAMNIYNTAFISNDLAMGQARAVIFFLVLAVVSVVQVYVNKKREIEL